MLPRGMRAASLLALALVAACSKQAPAPPCAEVVDHMLSLAPEPIATTDDERRQMIDQCEKESSADLRRCQLAAKDLDAYFTCSP